MPRLDMTWVSITGQRGKLGSYNMPEQTLERSFGCPRQLSDRSHAHFSKPSPRHRADAPHQLDRKITQEIELSSRINDDEPVRLRDLRSNLCQMFRACDANGNRQAQLCSHPASNGARNFRRRSKQMSTPCYVCESLIDREPFD